MPRSVMLGKDDTAEAIVARRFGRRSEGDRNRLTKEIADLIQDGRMIAGQGGAFRSRRTVHLGEEIVGLNARFGKLGLLDRLAFPLRR